MQRVISLVAAIALVVPMAASAQSAKNAVQLSRHALLTPAFDESTGWTSILNTQIRTSQQKDLIIGVSLETGLVTKTVVRSKNNVEDTAWAEANVRVRVLVDGNEAVPGVVTYDKRYQELMAKFAGFNNCFDASGDGVIDPLTECTLDPEELSLLLDTMAAHHFAFVLDDLGSGLHNVVVQAQVITDKGLAGSQLGEATARGLVGKGSLTVEEVRLVNGAVIEVQ